MSIYKSNEEIEKLLDHKNNGLKKIDVEVRIIGSGKHGHGGNGSGKNNGHNNLEEKTEAAVLATLIGGRATSEILGKSESQISKFKNGKNSNNDIDPELIINTEKRLDKISDKALDKVEALMEMFDENRMSDLKASELPSAAEKVVNVFEKLSKHGKGSEGQASKPSVIIYAPKQIKVDQYITKEV